MKPSEPGGEVNESVNAVVGMRPRRGSMMAGPWVRVIWKTNAFHSIDYQAHEPQPSQAFTTSSPSSHDLTCDPALQLRKDRQGCKGSKPCGTFATCANCFSHQT